MSTTFVDVSAKIYREFSLKSLAPKQPARELTYMNLMMFLIFSHDFWTSFEGNNPTLLNPDLIMLGKVQKKEIRVNYESLHFLLSCIL